RLRVAGGRAGRSPSGSGRLLARSTGDRTCLVPRRTRSRDPARRSRLPLCPVASFPVLGSARFWILPSRLTTQRVLSAGSPSDEGPQLMRASRRGANEGFASRGDGVPMAAPALPAHSCACLERASHRPPWRGPSCELLLDSPRERALPCGRLLPL